MIATTGLNPIHSVVTDVIRRGSGADSLSELLLGLLIVIVIIVLLLSQEDLEVGMAP